MTAALKPRGLARRTAGSRRSTPQPPIGSDRTAQSQRQQSRYALTAVPNQPSPPTPLFKTMPLPLPTTPPLPAWLQRLITLQRGSAIAASVLMALSLTTYGWTVYTQQLWGQEYRKLEGLQRRERQMIAADEGLKDQIARDAEQPEAGLVMPNPTTTILLQPAAARPAAKLAAPIAPTAEALKPMAY